MDDGGKDGNGLLLYTDSFSKEEVFMLIQALKNKFNLDTNMRHIKKKQYKIYVKINSMELLRNIVKPYKGPGMLYKIGL